MISNVSHLNRESVVTFFKKKLYGAFIWKYNSDELENAVHYGTNVLEEYIPFHITHRWLLCPLIDQYYTRHEFIFRSIKFLHRQHNLSNTIIAYNDRTKFNDGL